MWIWVAYRARKSNRSVSFLSFFFDLLPFSIPYLVLWVHFPYLSECFCLFVYLRENSIFFFLTLATNRHPKSAPPSTNSPTAQNRQRTMYECFFLPSYSTSNNPKYSHEMKLISFIQIWFMFLFLSPNPLSSCLFIFVFCILYFFQHFNLFNFAQR